MMRELQIWGFLEPTSFPVCFIPFVAEACGQCTMPCLGMVHKSFSLNVWAFIIGLAMLEVVQPSDLLQN